MNIILLAASPFLGGIERQMIGLALGLPAEYRTTFLSYPERGLCAPFLNEARRLGIEARALVHNAPNFRAAVRELTAALVDERADVLVCHGYKPDLLGVPAARRAGIPVVAVSHGWTAATLKVRINEALDRLSLRAMDRVVCVSEEQGVKVRSAGVPAARVRIIRDAIDAGRFANRPPDPAARAWLDALFPEPAPRHIVGAAGRLSPEKGFARLVEAAALLARSGPDAGAGFVLFGEGPLRADLERRIAAEGLSGRFVLAGFRSDLDRFLPLFDVLALPSYTEGLPNIVLEANAAGVPVVATAVGGTPEAILDGENGYLVPPGDPAGLALRIGDLLQDAEARRAMGLRGQARVREHFTFEAQCLAYQQLFEELTTRAATRSARQAFPIGRS